MFTTIIPHFFVFSLWHFVNFFSTYLQQSLRSIWPRDSWLIAQDLKKLGYKKEYQEILKALFNAYQEIGFIPEFYAVLDNKITLQMKKPVFHPQAWAIGVLLNMLVAG